MLLPDPDMVTGSTLTFFRRQPHDPDAGLRQARSCVRDIVPVSMDEMTLPSAASDTGRRHVDGLPSAIVVLRLDADHTGQLQRLGPGASAKLMLVSPKSLCAAASGLRTFPTDDPARGSSASSETLKNFFSAVSGLPVDPGS